MHFLYAISLDLYMDFRASEARPASSIVSAISNSPRGERKNKQNGTGQRAFYLLGKLPNCINSFPAPWKAKNGKILKILTLELVLGLDPEHLEVLEDGEHDVAHGAGPRRYGEQADEVPAEAAGGLRAPGHQDALAAEDVHANLEGEKIYIEDCLLCIEIVSIKTVASFDMKELFDCPSFTGRGASFQCDCKS